MRYFIEKMAKIAQRLGLRPQTSLLRLLGALPPDPQLPTTADPLYNYPIGNNSWQHH